MKKNGHPVVAICLWGGGLVLLAMPVIIAAINPLQNSRDFAYVTGGLSGVTAFCLLLLQPLLVSALIPGLSDALGRRLHRWIGSVLVLLVLVHVGGLYLTSPQDMTDALMLVAPTPFSLYGVIALWALLLTALLVIIRFRIVSSLGPKFWNIAHNVLALVIVGSSVVHTVMIDGAMGYVSKWIAVVCLVALTTAVTLYLRLILPIRRAGKSNR